MITGLLRNDLPPIHRPLVDSGKPVTLDDLIAIAKCVDGAEYKPERKHRVDYGRHDNKKPSYCTICNRVGHKTSECWFRDRQGQQNPTRDNKQTNEVLCFICGMPGHIAPECPHKKTSKNNYNGNAGVAELARQTRQPPDQSRSKQLKLFSLFDPTK